MDDALLIAAAERFGTPLYLYDLGAVDAQLARLRAALPEAEVRYAVKANANRAVLARLAERGAGVEAITLGELERSLRAGVPAARVLLGGPRQDVPLVTRAAEAGVGAVSLDSASQWRLWREAPRLAPFLVRVNPGLDPRTHPHMATGAADSKFGLPPAAAGALAAEVVAAGGELLGFHVHAGSQIEGLGVYDEIFARLAPLYERFPEARHLDLGGGFRVPGFDLEGFAERARAFCRPRRLALTLEPGRLLVADAGVLLTRALHVKEGARRHVIADAGMAELLRPALYDAEHPVRALTGAVGAEPAGAPTDLDGPLCENADRLARGALLPELRPGALLAVGRAGAYGFGMASNYASSLRPAEAVLDGGRLRLVRRRETVEDLVRLELEAEVAS